MPDPCATVVVDTTELYRHALLVTGRWKELLSRSRRGQVKVIIPEVVLRESARHFDKQMRKEVSDAFSTFSRLKELDALGAPDLGKWEAPTSFVDLYVEQITELLGDNGARVAPIPDIPHESVLKRDLAGRKPFSSTGKGYRDTLIWETLLALLPPSRTGDRIMFVTSNTSDFSDKSGSLAAELGAEVAALGMATVEIVPTVTDALQQMRECLDELERDDEDAAILSEDVSLGDLVSSAVLTEVERLVGESVVNAGSAKFSAAVAVDDFLPQEVEDATIEEIDLDDASVEYSVYDHYTGDTRAISASVDVGVELHGFVYKMDVELVDDDMVEVIDDDWNDHWTLVQMSTRLRMSFDLLIVGTTVENIALDSVVRIT